MKFKLFLASALVLILSCKQETAKTPVQATTVERFTPPNEVYGELFEAIQLNAVFPDSKTFVDCTPRFAPKKILVNYEKEKTGDDFDLKTFVNNNFNLPTQYSSGFKSDPNRSIEQHVNALWDVLTREADTASEGSSLIPLPKSYIVPGGRFGEIYYWDSYFTMLGLAEAGRVDMIENMVDNFSYLIDNLGFIPNGNRTYFAGRSQPPFYSVMVNVLAEQKGDEVIKKYLPQLEKEYAFWMQGSEGLNTANPSHRRVVRLNDDIVMNRYWDDLPAPRPESYKEDVELAKTSERDAEDLYRNLRAACESGWDFSTRWFRDGKNLATIRTTELIPVDQNALLYHLERMLERAYDLNGDRDREKEIQEQANKRKAALSKYCWSEEGFFTDYDFLKKTTTDIPTLAGMYPLFFNMASQQQADQAAAYIQKHFLKSGGVVSTLTDATGQQWDSPNGWAPLQWITIQGLRNYGHDTLASTISERWITLNKKVYKNTGKMVEKYNVIDMSLNAGGGEYPVQDGFGWSNGVLLRLLK